MNHFAQTTVEPATLLAIGGLLIITIVLMRAIYRRRRYPERSPQIYSRDQLSDLKNPQGMRNDMEELLLQLQELSRQINAQIDTKFSKLEASIRSADKRIAQLEHLNRMAKNQPAFEAVVTDYAETSEPISQAPSAEVPPNPKHQKIYMLADAGQSVLQIAQHTNLSIGEVELILALRKTSTTKSSSIS